MTSYCRECQRRLDFDAVPMSDEEFCSAKCRRDFHAMQDLIAATEYPGLFDDEADDETENP